MVDYLWMWSELIVRWVHVIAGIAWIGSSFYFIALDLSLKPGRELPDEAHGQAWQVHGGGFYNMVKYLVAPAKMPDELTWFKWEAYGTWISGIALMSLVYYGAASLYMIDLEILDITELQAVMISLAGIVISWALYDGLCRSPLGRRKEILRTLRGRVEIQCALRRRVGIKATLPKVNHADTSCEHVVQARLVSIMSPHHIDTHCVHIRSLHQV